MSVKLWVREKNWADRGELQGGEGLLQRGVQVTADCERGAEGEEAVRLLHVSMLRLGSHLLREYQSPIFLDCKTR